MSRIIVKNLPSGCKEEKVRNLFGEKGMITDCTLKYTKEGVFRKFAFIGYRTEKEAEDAASYFNNSYMNTNKLVVEIAKNFGDSSKPRAWSKYSRDSSAFQKMVQTLKEKEDAKKKKDESDEKKSKKGKTEIREGKVDSLLGDLNNDPKFQEFLEAHQNRTTKAIWTNDVTSSKEPVKGQKGSKVGKGQVAFDGDSDDDDDDEDESDSEEVVGDNAEDAEESNSDAEGDSAGNIKGEKASTSEEKAGVSDLDYLKSKMKKSSLFESDSDSSSESEEDDEKTKKKRKKLKEKSKKVLYESPKKTKDQKKKKKAASSSDDDDGDDDDDDESQNSSDSGVDEGEADGETSMDTGSGVTGSEVITHVIKMKGLPPTVRESQIRDFFRPQKPRLIRIPKNAKGKESFSFATVEFCTNAETDQAMGHNKNFIGPKKIYLYKVKKEQTEVHTPKQALWEIKLQQQRDSGEVEEEESIAESGRLYIRNLPYVCTEDDLEKVFGSYGPLTEVHLPVDMYTKKVKGFAFITYMMPEHAVKAYSELDGTAFQGRMLHILPGKIKKEEEITENMSYKKKQELKKKQAASSSHNWNALFLGANAVADVMAEKYGTAKSDILDASGRKSLGVRMALGETQIVAETRDFLIENGVALDSFSQAAAARSKTVILVKNLPAGTTAEEMREIFSKYGTLGRVVLPPSGITAVVEYLEPSEARAGFQRLAYTKHVPLYLEWAPMGVFTNPAPAPSQEGTEETSQEENMEQSQEGEGQTKIEESAQPKEAEAESSSEEEDVIEPESTLFIKNLNFETREDAVREKFEKYGPIRNITIAKKKDVKNPGGFLSLGYGFVEYKHQASAKKALKKLQHTELDEHQLELKISNRATLQKDQVTSKKKQDSTKKQKSSKILVRNVPFEAKVSEIRELFSVFGELKTVRLPKKLSGTGSHRGFGFVDFLTKQDAKRAFNALCHSTHLYGRRLVLEWAESEESVEQLRKKTADHFHEGGPSKKFRKSGLLDELQLGSGKSTDAN